MWPEQFLICPKDEEQGSLAVVHRESALVIHQRASVEVEACCHESRWKQFAVTPVPSRRRASSVIEHGERTKATIAERQKFSALLKMLRAGLT
jgi:hypothetical protein